jgi:glucose uptake protein GlcU
VTHFKQYNPFLALLAIVALTYLLHKIVFYSFNIDDSAFHYSLEVLYLFFFALSGIILKVLLVVKEKSFDNVGMSFLLATSVKMVICYLILRPLLQIPKSENTTERMNFFMLFIIFLAIETLLTIRIVNEKK